jgi:starch-binding outer membrane protein, SusD/RagB family
VTRKTKLASLALISALATAGCNDFLTGGDLTRDPNRPPAATLAQLFAGAQAAIWAEYSSQVVRMTEMFVQHFEGFVDYESYYQYSISEDATNGGHQALYLSGGLVDMRKLQAGAIAVGDSMYLGTAQVMEAMMMLIGADVFGDIVYTEALEGGNPNVTPQMEVYDSLLEVLDAAIFNISRTGPTNVGPGSADLSFCGSGCDLSEQRVRWTALAHTLKARIYLHLAEVRGNGMYAFALTEAQQGIGQVPGSVDYTAVWSGNVYEENLWYQFMFVQRAGYLEPDPFFVNLMESRNDPRIDDYFSSDFTNLSDERLSPTFSQPFVTADENSLILAEAAYRTGNQNLARTELNEYRTRNGLPTGSESGSTLLREILTEKYIVLFQNVEAYNDYKRNCYPNLTPTVSGKKITARLFYDTQEINTNPNLPTANEQPTRNANDPPNATDPFGAACKGQ